MILLTMLLIPTFVAFMFFILSGKKITIGEFGLQNLLQIGVMSLFIAGHGCLSTHDTEIWNGVVASKKSEHVSCSHSYPCNPYPCNCDKHGCSTCWHTCYEHSYDVDWEVFTSNHEEIDIDRVDRQGLREPPRFSAVKIGEPTSVAHSYVNYIKAAPDSLFRKQGLVEKYEKTGSLVAPPQRIYDYYRLDRLVLTNGATVDNPAEWNRQLSELNGSLGAKKQVNISVVITKNQPDDYFYALQQSWMGGKKNDVVLVMSIDDNKKIQWAEVMAWTTDKMAEVTIKDAVLGIGSVQYDSLILNAVAQNVDTYYHRKPMKDFEYLAHSAVPTLGVWIWSMIVGLIVSVGLGIFFMKNDFDQEDENEMVDEAIHHRRY